MTRTTHEENAKLQNVHVRDRMAEMRNTRSELDTGPMQACEDHHWAIYSKGNFTLTDYINLVSFVCSV